MGMESASKGKCKSYSGTESIIYNWDEIRARLTKERCHAESGVGDTNDIYQKAVAAQEQFMDFLSEIKEESEHIAQKASTSMEDLTRCLSEIEY